MASRRNYLDQTELAQFADITITDTTEADDQISMAEELIDAYVGPQDSFIKSPIQGRFASVASSSSMTLESKHQSTMQKDYLVGCLVEIIGGTGSGARKRITAQTYAGVITTEAFSTAPDSTSIYRIWQIGKFPRHEDVYFDGQSSPTAYYKQIPEEVKRATAAQVEFRINMGEAFFATDKSELQSERIGDYSYSKAGQEGKPVDALIAPKAKELLRGIRNRKGAIMV